MAEHVLPQEIYDRAVKAFFAAYADGWGAEEAVARAVDAAQAQAREPQGGGLSSLADRWEQASEERDDYPQAVRYVFGTCARELRVALARLQMGALTEDEREQYATVFRANGRTGTLTSYSEVINTTERILAARAVPAETLADRVRALGEMWKREAEERGPDDTLWTAGAADMVLALLDPAEQPATRCDCPPELMGAFGDHATNCPSREDGEACRQCGPGYRIGDEGCRHGGAP